MTKTKKQLRAEAVERLKNCVAARFDAESIIIALTSGRRGQSDWSLECDKLIYLLTDDSNDDSTPEKVVSGSKPCVTPESCRQYADQRKQGDYADCESCDSREKLEADVRKHYAYSTTTLMYPPSANKTTDMLRALPVDTVIGWLDRQAAITERECCKYIDGAGCDGTEVVHGLNGRIAELKEQVYELTAERGKIAELVGWRGEVDGNSGRPLLVPMVAAMCEGSEVAEKLRVRVEELTAERDKLQELNEYHALQYELASEDCDRLQAQVDELFKENDALVEERSNLQKQLRFTSAEREHYRSMCSNMATKIHDALMVMDEGMA